MQFRVLALHTDGSARPMTVDAADATSARRMLARDGLTVLELAPVGAALLARLRMPASGRDATERFDVDLFCQELLALVWPGRGDYDAETWPDALRQAGDTADANLTDYLLGTPLLAGYLEEGAAALGLSLEDFERG